MPSIHVRLESDRFSTRLAKHKKRYLYTILMEDSVRARINDCSTNVRRMLSLTQIHLKRKGKERRKKGRVHMLEWIAPTHICPVVLMVNDFNDVISKKQFNDCQLLRGFLCSSAAQFWSLVIAGQSTLSGHSAV